MAVLAAVLGEAQRLQHDLRVRLLREALQQEVFKFAGGLVGGMCGACDLVEQIARRRGLVLGGRLDHLLVLHHGLQLAEHHDDAKGSPFARRRAVAHEGRMLRCLRTDERSVVFPMGEIYGTTFFALISTLPLSLPSLQYE